MSELELRNAISVLNYQLGRDTPGKQWWNASLDRAPIYRALKIDPADDGAVYAAHPFRAVRSEDGWRVLAAWPAPAIFGEPDPDWLGIETVLSWDPVNNTVEILGDTTPQIVGAFEHDAQGVLFGQPFAFFRAWAEARAAFAIAYRAMRKAHFTVPAAECDRPGALIVGDPAKVRWREHELPETLTCIGIEAKTVNAAILRQANLPRAITGHSLARAA